MLLESMIDHEYPPTMKMEVEAPMASMPACSLRSTAQNNDLHANMSIFFMRVQLIEMLLEEMEMPGQHLPAPDAPDTVRHLICMLV